MPLELEGHVTRREGPVSVLPDRSQASAGQTHDELMTVPNDTTTAPTEAPATRKRENIRAPKNKKSKAHKNSLKSGDDRLYAAGRIAKKPDLNTIGGSGAQNHNQAKSGLPAAKK